MRECDESTITRGHNDEGAQRRGSPMMWERNDEGLQRGRVAMRERVDEGEWQ